MSGEFKQTGAPADLRLMTAFKSGRYAEVLEVASANGWMDSSDRYEVARCVARSLGRQGEVQRASSYAHACLELAPDDIGLAWLAGEQSVRVEGAVGSGEAGSRTPPRHRHTPPPLAPSNVGALRDAGAGRHVQPRAFVMHEGLTFTRNGHGFTPTTRLT